MNIHQYRQLWEKRIKAFTKLMQSEMPVHAGILGVDHFKENFRNSGFVGHSVDKWKTTRRQLSQIGSSASKYGPLLSRQRNLFSSMYYIFGAFRVVIITDLSYAPYNNWGAIIPVMPKSRRFFRSQFVEGTKGNDKNNIKAKEAQK